jgi:hypothetical protein
MLSNRRRRHCTAFLILGAKGTAQVPGGVTCGSRRCSCRTCWSSSSTTCRGAGRPCSRGTCPAGAGAYAGDIRLRHMCHLASHMPRSTHWFGGRPGVAWCQGLGAVVACHGAHSGAAFCHQKAAERSTASLPWLLKHHHRTALTYEHGPGTPHFAAHCSKPPPTSYTMHEPCTYVARCTPAQSLHTLFCATSHPRTPPCQPPGLANPQAVLWPIDRPPHH